MELKEIRNMRLKQIAVTNGLLVAGMVLFFIIISIFEIRFTHFYFALGLLMFLQGMMGLLRGESTTSMIPIFERVAIYEKQKMGKEWYKQRKSGRFASLILSALLFFQAYLYRNFQDYIFEIDVVFMSTLVFVILSMVNIFFLIHFRKVDRSTSEADMKGYMWKSNLIAVVVGLALGVMLFTFILIYVLSNAIIS